MNKLMSSETSYVFRRMELSLLQKFVVIVFPIARENATKVIRLFDAYSYYLEFLEKRIFEVEQKIFLLNHYPEEFPDKDFFSTFPRRNVKFSMKRYKENIGKMEPKIFKCISELKSIEDQYGNQNLNRFLYSLLDYFNEGYTYVALLNEQTQHEWNLRAVQEQIYKTVKQPYYILAGNKIDKDGLSVFNVSKDSQMTGVVINNICTIDRMLNLVNEYYKMSGVCEVEIIPFN
ncbi:MAG: hypothetical protein J6J60_05570 [Clostridia bacterium]|nr:hypothetical protein [Clostridia bacterium]